MMNQLKELKLWQWQQGRQHAGYEKMLLAGLYHPLKCDLYLLRYKQGSYIKPHVDSVQKGRHFRINIILKQAKCGSQFICDKTIFSASRINVFRSDISEHSVSEVRQERDMC